MAGSYSTQTGNSLNSLNGRETGELYSNWEQPDWDSNWEQPEWQRNWGNSTQTGNSLIGRVSPSPAAALVGQPGSRLPPCGSHTLSSTAASCAAALPGSGRTRAAPSGPCATAHPCWRTAANQRLLHVALSTCSLHPHPLHGPSGRVLSQQVAGLAQPPSEHQAVDHCPVVPVALWRGVVQDVLQALSLTLPPRPAHPLHQLLHQAACREHLPGVGDILHVHSHTTTCTPATPPRAHQPHHHVHTSHTTTCTLPRAHQPHHHVHTSHTTTCTPATPPRAHYHVHTSHTTTCTLPRAHQPHHHVHTSHTTSHTTTCTPATPQ